VHEYTRLNLDVVHAIITKQLVDFRTFSSIIVKACVWPGFVRMLAESIFRIE